MISFIIKVILTQRIKIITFLNDIRKQNLASRMHLRYVTQGKFQKLPVSQVVVSKIIVAVVVLNFVLSFLEFY